MSTAAGIPKPISEEVKHCNLGSQENFETTCDMESPEVDDERNCNPTSGILHGKKASIEKTTEMDTSAFKAFLNELEEQDTEKLNKVNELVAEGKQSSSSQNRQKEMQGEENTLNTCHNIPANLVYKESALTVGAESPLERIADEEETFRITNKELKNSNLVSQRDFQIYTEKRTNEVYDKCVCHPKNHAKKASTYEDPEKLHGAVEDKKISEKDTPEKDKGFQDADISSETVEEGKKQDERSEMQLQQIAPGTISVSWSDKKERAEVKKISKEAPDKDRVDNMEPEYTSYVASEEIQKLADKKSLEIDGFKSDLGKNIHEDAETMLEKEMAELNIVNEKEIIEVDQKLDEVSEKKMEHEELQKCEAEIERENEPETICEPSANHVAKASANNEVNIVRCLPSEQGLNNIEPGPSKDVDNRKKNLDATIMATSEKETREEKMVVPSGVTARTQMVERRARTQKEQALNCPRCNSTNTKFCYYNNYSLTQPRYFCKTCRRYWTEGGSLRNVPVGGGSRKNKRSSSSSSSSSTTTNSNNTLSSSSSSAAAVVSSSTSGKLTPPTISLSSASQNPNPKFYEGQDLNLTFPHLGLFPNIESISSCNTTTTTTTTSSSTRNCSNLELLRAGMSGRGLVPFMSMPLVPEASNVYSSGFGMQEFRPPTLSFPLDGARGGGNNDCGNMQGVQENAGRLLFPFEDLKPVPASSADQFEQSRPVQGGDPPPGFWNAMMGGGGSW